LGVLLVISRGIDAVNQKIGVVATYLILLAALISAFNASVRYGLTGLIGLSRYFQQIGSLDAFTRWYSGHSNALIESQWYMFAAVVMLGAAYTLKLNEHVRVDLLYGSVSERPRLWIDLFGALFFLLPICLVLIYFTWPWFLDSWRTGETSASAGGLVRWPVKLMLPLGFALVALQGVSEIIKSAATLLGFAHREYAYEKPLQ
jgi:TRAP-type mannitol/chloroaromatic compound transport system permease small subunit